MIRAAFLGTPEVAVPTLRRLAGVAEVAVAVTRPDRPRGRSGRPLPPPVKEAALEAGIPVVQPERSGELAALLAARGPLDVAVVVAFGMLVPPDALAVPAAGMLNVHFSILPRWRGAAPIQWAILSGDERTGVTVIEMDEGLDTGPIVATNATRLGPGETAGEALERLSVVGANLVTRVLPDHVAGRIPAVAQPPHGATRAPRVGPEDARLDLAASPEAVSRRVLAMSPKPGAFALLDGRRFRVLRARPAAGEAEPGRLFVTPDGELACGTGGGAVLLEVVQPEGRRPMPGADWARGRHGDPGRLT